MGFTAIARSSLQNNILAFPDCASPPSMLGVRFVPLSIPLERRQQTFAVLFHIFVFAISPLVIALLPFVLGAYRSRWFSNIRLHRWASEYFPLSFHRTADLPADKNYLVCMHPHGIGGLSSQNFYSNCTGVHDEFPNIDFHLCTLESNFLFPLRREWLMLHGVIDCSKESLRYVLGGRRGGQAAVLVVGGAEEALEARPGRRLLALANRKGFIRIALQTFAHLVPVFVFGENDIYMQVDNPRGSVFRWLQDRFKRAFSFSPVVAYGRGIFLYNIGFMPFRKPLNTVMGAPIPVERVEKPTSKQVDQLHALYIEKLTELFEEHKERFGIQKENHLEFY